LYFSPLRKIFVFFTTLKTLFIFHSGQVAHYNKTSLKKSLHFSPLLKNLCIFPHFKIFVFSTWAGRPLQQDHFEESLHFSPF